MYVVGSQQLSTLLEEATDHQRQEDGSPVRQAGALATVLNACADWAGKQVTVRESAAHQHLYPMKRAVMINGAELKLAPAVAAEATRNGLPFNSNASRHCAG
jgi:hypothetical protein